MKSNEFFYVCTDMYSFTFEIQNDPWLLYDPECQYTCSNSTSSKMTNFLGFETGTPAYYGDGQQHLRFCKTIIRTGYPKCIKAIFCHL